MASGNRTGNRRLDLTGQTYGKLFVDSHAYTSDNKFYWNCVCDCGNNTIVHTALLRAGKVKSCGCLSNKHDLSGKRFGRLTVLYETSEVSSYQSILWFCKCDCGNEGLFSASQLVAGKRKSCGCLFKDIHWKGVGDLGHTYFSSIQRGAEQRGIEFDFSIEQMWELFKAQDGRCALTGIQLFIPSSKAKNTDDVASLDRIDSTKGYVEGNVQWVQKHINLMKLDKSEDFFVDLCRRVVQYVDRR